MRNSTAPAASGSCAKRKPPRSSTTRTSCRCSAPANLILDGETVWVTDFGLAKLLNTDGLTATGDILGTLQYLPPECLHGHADARSDVYGLGATLYELLTLEPPYAADSPAKLTKL